MILLTTSPTPIGRTPGFLSKAISLHAVKEDRPSGSTYSVQILLGIIAMLLQRSDEALEKDVHILRRPEAFGWWACIVSGLGLVGGSLD